MEKLRLIGVGCYGKPDRVVKMFNKISKDCKGIYDIPCLSSIKNALGPESVQIAGFLFGYKNQMLRMSLFLKRGSHNSVQTGSITYPLDRKKAQLH